MHLTSNFKFSMSFLNLFISTCSPFSQLLDRDCLGFIQVGLPSLSLANAIFHPLFIPQREDKPEKEELRPAWVDEDDKEM